MVSPGSDRGTSSVQGSTLKHQANSTPKLTGTLKHMLLLERVQNVANRLVANKS